MFIIGIVGSSDIKIFSSGLSGIDLSRQVQISMDGQYWNQKFCEEVKQERENIDHSGLSDRGSCNLHRAHSAFKSGCKK